MNRALSLIDINFDAKDDVTYFLIDNNSTVAEIKIKYGGRKITIKNSKKIKIVKNKIYTEWYKNILASFISFSNPPLKHVYNCVDKAKCVIIGTITFDEGYKSFKSNVSTPYYWVSSDDCPNFILHTSDSNMTIKNNLSDVLPLPTCMALEKDIRFSYDGKLQNLRLQERVWTTR